MLKAYNDAPICIQRDPFRRDLVIEGSEDCLYLNVYAPEVVNEALPVMVFFHGGGYMVRFLYVFTIFKISPKPYKFSSAAVASNPSTVPITYSNMTSFTLVQTSASVHLDSCQPNKKIAGETLG